MCFFLTQPFYLFVFFPFGTCTCPARFYTILIWFVDWSCLFAWLTWYRSVWSCGFVPDGNHSHLSRWLSASRWRCQGRTETLWLDACHFLLLFFLIGFLGSINRVFVMSHPCQEFNISLILFRKLIHCQTGNYFVSIGPPHLQTVVLTVSIKVRFPISFGSNVLSTCKFHIINVLNHSL